VNNRKILLPVLLSIALVFSLILPVWVAGASANVPLLDDHSISHLAVDSSSAVSEIALNTPQGEVTPMVAAGQGYTVGLKADGTVVAIGNNKYGQCNVGGWTDITQVAAGEYHTVGLASDGTVVAIGNNKYGQCNVGGWTDITQVAAGEYHTVGLKADGTVVAMGNNEYGQCNVGGWTDIIQVAAGYYHTVGLASDGTVVAVGANEEGQCYVGGWTDITQVAAGGWHTVGVKSDGTVVAVGKNHEGQCDVGGWTDITQVTATWYHTVGLASDGTVVAVGWNEDGRCDVDSWTDIIQVAAGHRHTVGVKADGTVVAVGWNEDGRCDVDSWTDIIQVAAGLKHTVGLKSDGTVVAVGYNGSRRCNVGSWSDIVQVAAGEYHTVGVKNDGTVVAAGPGREAELAKWNLVLALPPSQCVLTISSTSGGSVTTPGEGTFTYDQGTATDLMAGAEENYEFVEWAGDINTIADVYAAQTTITMDDYYSITANFELEEGLCSLTISSTGGGLVTTPGEGTSIYDERTTVDLVAEAEEGYHFLNWTGDVDTIADVNAAATNITMDDIYSITANFVCVEAGNIGIKAGDWIKVEYIGALPDEQPYDEWLKLEFLSVEGTNASVQVTMHMSDGTEQSVTAPVDLGEGDGEALGLSGVVVSANLTTGDSVCMTGYSNVTIEGETTRTYAGARRTVVYASTSLSIPYQDEDQLTYYWDKLTGVVVEVATTYSGMTITAKVTETNMWEATTVRMPWWLWIIVAAAAAAGLVIFFVLRKRAA
jgi:alpha-tubulin suppressor-like RCC1 family protein